MDHDEEIVYEIDGSHISEEIMDAIEEAVHRELDGDAIYDEELYNELENLGVEVVSVNADNEYPEDMMIEEIEELDDSFSESSDHYTVSRDDEYSMDEEEWDDDT